MIEPLFNLFCPIEIQILIYKRCLAKNDSVTYSFIVNRLQVELEEPVLESKPILQAIPTRCSKIKAFMSNSVQA